MMKYYRVVLLAAVSLLLLLVSACGAESDTEEETTIEGDIFVESPFEEFDASNFGNSTNIDNQWLPLQPGTRWVYEGTTTEDDETFDHRIEFTVTELTKVIEDVPAVVAWVLDYSDDELVEAEIAFYAQDNDGNVWFLGEYPEEYEEGELVSAITWIAGLSSARPGIAMMADPQLDMPSYSQGYAPEIHWSDWGQVIEMGQETCVAVDCYQNVLVTQEYNQTEPNAFQLKYYAPGVGNVQVGWRGEDATQEELELVEYGQLDADALMEANKEALRLEKDAYYLVSPDVYGHSVPIETEIILEAEFVDFDPNNFDDPTNIDNQWFPLQPGAQLILDGTTTEDFETTDHRIEFTVTDLTKEIEGVQTVVAWIEDFSDDELVEAEIAFYAQDNEGNVWFFGEYPEEYEDGEFVVAPTWIAGVQNARPGVQMKAAPQLDTEGYFQGWGPAVDWNDYGKVDQMGQETCVPADCYEDVLVIAESSLDEWGAFQLKYYARGVGNVQVGWQGEDATQEELELVAHNQLDEQELAEVRAAALAMEEHAYLVSEHVYALTTPSEVP